MTAAAAQDAPGSSDGRVVKLPPAADRGSRTFVCTVLFLDIVEYSKKSVADQLQVKERLNARIAEAIRDVADTERIILDTGDGLAINFLGDPEDALLVALNLGESLARAGATEPRFEVRVGINLGPVRLLRDINGQPNIIGDGINVAQRVMSFAQPGQALVSRAYHEVVSRISEDHSRLFAYQGSRTDKHVREHEIYAVAATASDAGAAAIGRIRADARRAGDTVSPRRGVAASLLSNRMLALGVTVLSVLVLTAAVLTFALPEAPAPVASAQRRPTPARAEAPPFSEPAALMPAPAPVTPPAPTPPVVTKSPQQPPAVVATRSATSEGRTGYVQPEPQPALVRPRPEPPAVESTRAEPVAPKPPATPTALVILAISPWGEVYVDGKPAGVSPPLRELELAPGRHTIVVRNGGFKPFEEEVELGSNQTLRIKHKFTQR